MTALGTVTVRPPRDVSVVRLPITDYKVTRGNYLGTLTVKQPMKRAPRQANIDNYVVRQISILYRQLWPSHGQRFPQ